MTEDRITAERDTPAAPAAPDAVDDMTEEILVEEVSIDGMCGVY